MRNAAKKGTPQNKRGPIAPSDKLRKRQDNSIVISKKKKPRAKK